MRKYIYFLLLTICSSVSAQTDSGYFDLGRVKLRKDFTQNITIKGSELEQMPFAHLVDAIGPWLQGAHSSRMQLVFIVDGNLINDVNAYSIYDIEEITLVQNAAVQVSGSVNAQQVVLITTKRKHAANRGLTVAAQSFLVKNKFEEPDEDAKSQSNLYHQWHVSAWQDLRNVRFGASANFMRDVFPLEKDIVDTEKPTQMNRFRLNGFVDVTLAKGHTITAAINVVPQTISYRNTRKFTNYTDYNTYKRKQTLVNPSLKLYNQIAKGLSHELDLSLLTWRSPEDQAVLRTVYLPQTPPYEAETIMERSWKNNIFLLRDRLAYTMKSGQWQFEPSVGFTYRKAERENRYTGIAYRDGVIQSQSGGWSKMNDEAYVLTPTFTISYGNSFNFGGGMSAKLKKNNAPTDDKVFPFVSATVDLLRIARAGNPYSLKLFGSFAQAGNFTDVTFLQPDIAPDPEQLMVMQFYSTLLPGQYPEDAKINNLQAGLVFSLPNDKLQLSYNFDNRRYLSVLYMSLGPVVPGYIVLYPDMVFSAHRLGLLARAIGKREAKWTIGLNTTAYTLKPKEMKDIPARDQPERNNDKMIWTGGLTNRLQYGGFMFGVDILYRFNEQRYIGPPGANFKKYNSLRVNHLYAGYTFKAGGKPLELYLSTRNSLESDYPDFHDRRSYYGAGFKLLL